MEELITTIRAAAAADATHEARTSGAAACRRILTALEATPGQPLVQSQPTTPMHAIASVLGQMSPDQLLELAITRLKAALPQGETVSTTQPLRIPLLPIPHGV